MNSTGGGREVAITALESSIADASIGLPEDIFLFVSRITPLVNVDLLIKDETGRTLLTWRDDEYCGSGWHIPGGIIRHREPMTHRIHAVAMAELGATVETGASPIAVNEIIVRERATRGHFISFLFSCKFLTQPVEHLKFNGTQYAPGHWMWHEKCPRNLIAMHDMYRRFI